MTKINYIWQLKPGHYYYCAETDDGMPYYTKILKNYLFFVVHKAQDGKIRKELTLGCKMYETYHVSKLEGMMKLGE